MTTPLEKDVLDGSKTWVQIAREHHVSMRTIAQIKRVGHDTRTRRRKHGMAIDVEQVNAVYSVNDARSILRDAARQIKQDIDYNSIIAMIQDKLVAHMEKLFSSPEPTHPARIR